MTLGRWMCNCNDWMYRKLYEGGDCKHILEVKGLLETASIEELEQIKTED
jgi:predicted nucleic acid-binding Zn finger protein